MVSVMWACRLPWRFPRHFDVIGFDINTARVDALNGGHDATNEVDDASLAASTARFTSDATGSWARPV